MMEGRTILNDGEELHLAERRGAPLLLPRACAHWPAIENWAGSLQGLKRMRVLVPQHVQCSAMVSSSDIFVGDLRQYTPTTLT